MNGGAWQQNMIRSRPGRRAFLVALIAGALFGLSVVNVVFLHVKVDAMRSISLLVDRVSSNIINIRKTGRSNISLNESAPALAGALRPDTGPRPLSIEEFGARHIDKLSGTPKSLSCDDLLNETSNPGDGFRDTIIFTYPEGEFGLLCNIVHEITAALDIVMTYPDPSVRVVFALHEKIGQNIAQALDLPMMVEVARNLPTLDVRYLGITHPLHRVDIAIDWQPAKHNTAFIEKGFVVAMLKQSRLMRIQRHDFSVALTYMVRPASKLRTQAEAVVNAFRKTNSEDYLFSIHRRNFVWCQPQVKAYEPFCARLPRGNAWRSTNYYEDDCNITVNAKLEKDISKAFIGETQLSKPFSWFLASDLHDVGGDNTFREWSLNKGREILTIPHMENPEHKVMVEWEALKREGKSPSTGGAWLKDVIKDSYAGYDMNWDFSMLIDMHAQTLADYSLGAPWSSCDRILAMWRSIRGKASLSAFLQEREWNGNEVARYIKEWDERLSGVKSQMFPTKCYQGYERAEQSDYALYGRVMRFWHGQWRQFYVDPKQENIIVHTDSGTAIDVIKKGIHTSKERLFDGVSGFSI